MPRATNIAKHESTNAVIASEVTERTRERVMINRRLGYIVRDQDAAQATRILTLETAGALPTGEPLKDSIEAVDAATGSGPVYYMINCAHPTHIESAFARGSAWLKRLRGLRANASKRSHAELNDAPDLDAGDPVELGGQYRDLMQRFPHFTIFGGCCATDNRHIACIDSACRLAAA